MSIRGLKDDEVQTCEVPSEAIGRVKGKNCQTLNRIQRDHDTCVHVLNAEVGGRGV